MIKLKKIRAIDNEILDKIGFQWHTDSDGTSYVADEILLINEKDAQNYYNASNELYEMFIKAGEYVIKNNLWHEIGIPYNLVELIKKSWENDEHFHIYSRFDFSGGINNQPIKLIEFNADTPTAIFETSVIQWAMLKFNDLPDEQFNNLYNTVIKSFKNLITGEKILFSSAEGNLEEERTVKFLQNMAIDAGFETDFEYLHRVKFSEDGIFNSNDQYFRYWFKLYPWENIALEESDLIYILEKIYANNRGVVLNPPYVLIFQSKAILKIINDLFPDSPYILKASFDSETFKNKKYVQKRFFGREGNNIRIVSENSETEIETGGNYEMYRSVYQEYTEFITDQNNLSYQAGVFFSGEGCGLGFRRGGKILNNMSKFIGHMVNE